MDELFEVFTLVQTNKIDKIPIVLYGSDFWGGLKDWIIKTMKGNGYISDGDENLLEIVDSTDAAMEIIKKFYSKESLKPNF
jgi:predicted Rossmann-fold nucleotide-binding protein